MSPVLSFRLNVLAVAATAAVALCLGASPACAGTAMGSIRLTSDRGALDLGAAPADEVRSVTLAMKIPNRAGLEAFIASTIDPSSPNFRKFLTPEKFAVTYGQTDEAVARVTSYLQAHGLAVTKVFKNRLLIQAKGTNAQLATVFGSPIHKFSLAGQTYQRPVIASGVPAELQAVVGAVAGLSTQAIFKPHNMRRPKAFVSTRTPCGQSDGCIPTPDNPATQTPGDFTTADVAEQYNIKPVYQRGITGFRTTIAILTFASLYDPNDPYGYWAQLGLKVARARVTEVPVDGGSPNDGSTAYFDGQIETTIDVEHAGGIAPQARMLVYEAPNTAAGFIDLYAQAVDDNLADLMSTSWGNAEVFNDADLLAAHDAIMLQAAAQGIPVVAAAGDSGAFDLNPVGSSTAYPGCSATLSVDFPASSPYVLAAGGTTRPAAFSWFGNHGNITIPAERPWAWDWARDYYLANPNELGQASYYANAFAVGGGGGVSVQYPMPYYQNGLTGTKTSAAGQSLLCQTGKTVVDLADLPVGYAGRNVPDVSLNADPATGFWIWLDGDWAAQGTGGTSFVAPQLAGIFALVTQQLGTRVGFLNPQLYSLYRRHGYGAGSPFNPITTGSNEFYKPTNPASYNPASGLGTLNVDNLVKAMTQP